MEGKELYKVTKSNALIEASYSLSLEEQRILLAAISCVDSRSKFPDKITIAVQDFAELFNLNKKSAYRHLREAADKLFEREIVIKDNNTGKPSGRQRWVGKVYYHENEGKVDLHFWEAVKPYLSQLQGEFTSYHLKYITELNSSYAIRIYELLIQYKRLNMQRVIPVKDLREKLNLGTKYPKFSDFRKRVLLPAIKSINANTDIEVAWEPIKNGRTIESISFVYKTKKQMKLPLDQ